MRKLGVLALVIVLAACGHPSRTYAGGDVVKNVKTTAPAAIPAGQRPGFLKAAIAAIGDRLEDEGPESKAVVDALTSQVVALDKDLAAALEKALSSDEKSERAGALHVIVAGGASSVKSAGRRVEVDTLAEKSGANKDLVAAAREALAR